MIEKTQKDDAAVREAEPDAAPVEPAEIKACVGATGGGEGTASAIPPEELERLHADLVTALKTVFDPEIPVDIYELGLIYRLEVDDDRNVEVDMTLTAPGCPVAGDMPGWVENAVSSVPGVGQVKVNLVFDPPWDMSRMSDEARLALNMF
ncbi:MAG TPA: SUF system Fe-S cluster assembly protein [Methyloceanibacter sp.]|nr:SUF system Fe-S cluster assembly protein [Methyloceanibacter sp.]